MKLIISAVLWFIIGTFFPMSVSACGSYEKCLEEEEYFNDLSFSGSPNEILLYQRNAALLKAIALKLDEISKQLNTPVTAITYGFDSGYWADYCKRNPTDLECVKNPPRKNHA